MAKPMRVTASSGMDAAVEPMIVRFGLGITSCSFGIDGRVRQSSPVSRR
jgi:hypothetical protein